MKNKKIAASVLALSLITSAATANVVGINKLIPVNSITASAITRSISADGNWQYDQYSDRACLVKYLGSDSNVMIPESIKNAKTNKSYAVTEINPQAFYNNTIITSVSVCRGITEIKRETFTNAKNLKSVILPHGITKIDESAFSGTNIQEISLPSTIETIENDAFRDCPLTSITLGNGIKKIGNNAFENTKINAITIPSSIEKIGNNAFEKCTYLSYVKFDNISDDCEIGSSLFKGCDKITNINMNYSTFKITAKYGALGGCKNLTSINNTTILKYTDDGKPYFASRYASIIEDNFAINDVNHVSFMDQYFDAIVKYTVKTETANCNSDAERIRVLHDWVCNKVDYDYDSHPFANEAHCKSSVFFRDKTVCEGYANALTSLYRAAGLEAYNISGASYSSSNKANCKHAWTMVKLGDHYFHIDACHDDTETGVKLHHYLKSDNDIKKCSLGHDTFFLSDVDNEKLPSKKPECEFSLGDANMDHVVDENDSIYISNIILGNEEVKDMTLTDINGDGVIDTLDAINVNYLIIPE